MATVAARSTAGVSAAGAPRRTSSGWSRAEKFQDVFSAGERGKAPTDSKGAPPSFAEAVMQLEAAHAREVESLRRELRKMSQKATKQAADVAARNSEGSTKDGTPGTVNDPQQAGQQAELGSQEGAWPRQHSWDSEAEVSEDTFDDPFVVAERAGYDRNSIVWNPFAERQNEFCQFMNRYLKSGGQSRKKRMAYKIAKSWPFDAVTYFMIIANSSFIGIRMQLDMDNAQSNTPAEMWPEYVELGFVVFFALELLCKLLAEDVYVFFGTDWHWNLLDTILVLAALVQLAIESVNGSDTPNLTPTRNIRLFRITRVLRVVRVVQACQTLRVMIFSIFKSLDALIWVFVVLLYFMYIFAMIFMHGTLAFFESHLDSGGGDLSLQEQQFWLTPQDHIDYMKCSWSSIDRAIVTLFESVTGGRDWGEVYYSFLRVDPFYGLLYFGYVYFMVFLVLNVVIGTVVDVTTGVASKDRDRMVDHEIASLKTYATDIKTFFKQADTDNSGQLSWKEFKEHLENDRVKAYFQTLDLDIRKAHTLFKLLDRNDNGEVGIEEFLDGCLRLRGQAKSLDMNLVIYQLETLVEEISRKKLIPGRGNVRAETT